MHGDAQPVPAGLAEFFMTGKWPTATLEERLERVQPLHMDDEAIIRAQAAARAWAACALTQGATGMTDADVLAGCIAEVLGLSALQNGKSTRLEQA